MFDEKGGSTLLKSGARGRSPGSIAFRQPVSRAGRLVLQRRQVTAAAFVGFWPSSRSTQRRQLPSVIERLLEREDDLETPVPRPAIHHLAQQQSFGHLDLDGTVRRKRGA